MKNKKQNYKQKYEELKELQKHTNKYIHIPKVNPYPLLGFILLTALAIANFFLIISVGKVYKVWELLNSSEPDKAFHSFHQLIVLYPIIGEYILISCAVISLVALIKGGYNKLKSYDEKGLIFWLIVGLIAGLIFGLIFGLIVGLIAGLIVGLIGGLIDEFEQKSKANIKGDL